MGEDTVNALKTRAQHRNELRAELDKVLKLIDADILKLLQEREKTPKEIAALAGVSYEKVRTVARKHGIEPLREPTVTSRKKS